MIVAAGAGRMGRSIGIALALAGRDVIVADVKDRPAAEARALLDDARADVERSLDFLVAADVVAADRRDAVAARIAYVAARAADDALHSATIVFEGVTETLAAKEAVFARLSASLPATAIVASTSSTFSADELAHFVTHPERFIVTHWLNPAYLIPLVEVSPGSATAPATVAAMRALLDAAGKVTVVCKPSPGFIVPRIQALAMNEAARIVAEGVASAEDVDTAIRFGFGFRYAVMGLLEFIDLGGVDILAHASHHLRDALGSDRFTSPPIVDALVDGGDLGLKTGRGFYDWRGGAGEGRREAVMLRVVALLRHLDLLPPLR